MRSLRADAVRAISSAYLRFVAKTSVSLLMKGRRTLDTRPIL
jgi:hypothetical protein